VSDADGADWPPVESDAAWDYRYTDRQVREDPTLTELAYDYLRSYGGDYEYLVDCKEALHFRQDLTTAQIRGVLNCMRHDVHARAAMPKPIFEPFQPRPRRQHPPKLQVVREVYRPNVIELKAHFKGTYVTSTHRQAKKSHLLDHERSALLYYPHIARFMPDVKLYCSAAVSLKLFSDYALLEPCARCLEEKEHRG